MAKPKLKTVRFEADGKLVTFEARVVKPKPAVTTLIPISTPKTFKVGIHGRSDNKALKKAASAPQQKKFTITSSDSRTHVDVKAAPRQTSLAPRSPTLHVKKSVTVVSKRHGNKRSKSRDAGSEWLSDSFRDGKKKQTKKR